TPDDGGDPRFSGGKSDRGRCSGAVPRRPVILADSSAWIDLDRAAGSVADRELTRAISKDPGAVAVTEPILMDILAGARSETDAQRLRNMLTSLAWIPCDPVADFEGAATIYRLCRAGGVTPRSLDDCLIASIALRTDAELLTSDRGFEQIALVVPLRLYAA
ncbi:MAG: PIN domain nuclease, partial [Actinomycetia bacterium]|nr:PIN domain nuclease [Actinomycetes bacterium]